ncbi:MAG TPA: LysR family transcriptional regulator [Solirubrobacteraceae bacterium]|jgi:DNA-binding transcriptional LysR family regulator|nr:LysR family transcriptional regulator [Solirubrobacteraceae bacterium]
MTFTDLAGVDLNLLVALDALLSEGSVTRAGERLSLSQPAMSAALGRLRRQLGDELLVRSGQAMEPTGFALSLREPVGEVLAEISRVLAARPAFDPARDARHFRVFANDYVSAVLLAPLMRGLIVDAPGISLETVSAFRSLDGHLRDDRLDLVLAAGSFQGAERFPSAPLFSDGFVCVAGDRVTGLGERLTRAQLAALPYISYRQGGATSYADIELDRAGLTRRTALTVEGFVLVPGLLRGTHMIAMLQRRLLAALHVSGLQTARPPVRLAPLRERMYWHARATGDPAHEWLRERLLGVAAALGRG